MKLEVTTQDIERGKLLLLVFLCLILGQEFGLWRANYTTRTANETSQRLSRVVERQHTALQSCQGQVETQLLWMTGQHEGKSSYPAVERTP